MKEDINQKVARRYHPTEEKNNVYNVKDGNEVGKKSKGYSPSKKKRRQIILQIACYIHAST
jgi:hypothetical protein